jgi:hypothetical protein
MAELSAFWQGTSVGDADTDEYSSQNYSDIYSKIIGSHYSAGYILPGYNNNLKVQANSPAALNVIVKSGAVFLRGRIYENTADNTLSIAAADVTNPRIDRVVLQITFSAVSGQTVRAVILTGTPAATPTMPSLTQNSTTYEISLAYIWVAASAATIGDESVHDERVFAHNFEDQFFAESIIRHSEFLAPIVTSRIYPPAAWTSVGTITGIVSDTKPTQQPRGNSMKITAGANNSGIQQINPVLPSSPYVIRILTKVTAGDVGKITITTNSGAPLSITREVRITGTWLEEVIYYTTESDATTMTVQLLAANNTDIVWYGQSLAVYGYITGPFNSINYGQEILIDNFTLTAAAGLLVVEIPQDLPYKNIRIITVERSTDATPATTFSTSNRFSGDSGNNYDRVEAWYSHSGVITTFEGLAVGATLYGAFPGAAAPANVFGISETIIPDYKGIEQKTSVSLSGTKIGVASGNIRANQDAGFWRNTGAITKIDFIIASNHDVGTSIFVYLFN